MKERLQDKNIKSYTELISPKEFKNEISLSEDIKQTILEKRKQIQDILDKKDKRKLIIVGPCSIHNIKEALEYGKKLRQLQKKVEDKFLLVMRTYFEKPRTKLGWKGLIYDPDLNNTDNIEKGLKTARKFLIELANLGIPAGTEFLGPLVTQYIDDLVSWAAIGARTSESQTHREIVSGLSVPVGFKNTTSGDIKQAINASVSAMNPHSFLGIDKHGKICIVKTNGNKYCHLVLRGYKKQGEYFPNYKEKDINKTLEILEKENLSKRIIIDCSHGNSKKDYENQSKVFKEVMEQSKKNSGILGVMLESNLIQGKQKIPKDLKNLKKGISITDACLGWDETEKLILNQYKK